ncbi:hypothetical protein [Planktothrix sp. FACHB-1365]|uniref:hypothetical protein n=1 Tax=Planktothrix sp. FACHB-1365 TaxID=2692855 RepID=UPI001686FAA5|nr:hypothetical protein [Planktothrix sp. FACHB-1365]MBD2485823.1 hypothetical protein [Planktothrix sp. FACHB-1365]
MEPEKPVKNRLYRSSPSQLANLRRGPKGEHKRSIPLPIRMAPVYLNILKSHLSEAGLSAGDLLEAIAIRLERGDITIDDILKN